MKCKNIQRAFPAEKSASTRFSNIATVGHIDSGKTTLTDRLIFLSKDDTRQNWGSIEEGTTVTDISLLEKRRGITLFSVPAEGTYNVGDEEYNLRIIDTPGHSEIKYQTISALKGVDGALLLVDLKEGFRNHTANLLIQLQEASLPYIVVLNKIDLIPTGILESSVSRVYTDMGYLLPRQNKEGFKVLQLGKEGNFQSTSSFYCPCNSFAIPRLNFERRDLKTPFQDNGSLEALIGDSFIPAVLTSAKDGTGIIDLLALIRGYFPTFTRDTLSRKDAEPTKIQILNSIPQAGRLGETMVCKVESGKLERATRLKNPATREKIKVSAIYTPNLNLTPIACAGDIILLPRRSKTRSGSGEFLCQNDSEPNKEIVKVEPPLVSCDITVSDQDLIGCVEALKVLIKSDPSWRFDSYDGRIRLYGTNVFHLSLLRDILHEERGFNLEFTSPSPVYCISPESDISAPLNNPVLQGRGAVLEFDGIQDGEGIINSFSSKIPLPSRVGQIVKNYLSGLRWRKTFPIYGACLELNTSNSLEPGFKKSSGGKKLSATQVAESIIATLENLLHQPERVSLFEPHVVVQAHLKNPKSQDRLLRFYRTVTPINLEYVSSSANLATDTYGGLADLPLRVIIDRQTAFEKALRDVNHTIKFSEYKKVPYEVAVKLLTQKGIDTLGLARERPKKQKLDDPIYLNQVQDNGD